MKRTIEKRDAKITSPSAVVIALALIVAAIVLILAALSFERKEISPEINSKIDAKISEFAELYMGVINASISKKEVKNGMYIVEFEGLTRGGVGKFEILLDENLSIQKVSQLIQIPRWPPTIMPTGRGKCEDIAPIIGIYVDPLDPISRAYDNKIESFVRKFGEITLLQFHILATRDASLLPAKYFVCVKNDTKFSAFRKCVYELNESLNETMLDNCVVKAGIDLNQTKKCIEEKAIKTLLTDQTFATTYLGDLVSGAVVIDCEWWTWVPYAERVMCFLHQDICSLAE